MGREDPGWFVSSQTVFQTMGKSSTELDQGHATPKTQIRTKWGVGEAEGQGEAVGKEDVSKARRPEKPSTDQGGSGRREAKQGCRGSRQSHPMLDTDLNTQTEQGPKLRHTCHPEPVPHSAPLHSEREVKPWLYSGYLLTCCL